MFFFFVFLFLTGQRLVCNSVLCQAKKKTYVHHKHVFRFRRKDLNHFVYMGPESTSVLSKKEEKKLGDTARSLARDEGGCDKAAEVNKII